jgi:PKD domain-containing protein
VGGRPSYRRRVLVVVSWLCLTGFFGIPDAFAVTYGPDAQGLGPEQTVFDHSSEATGDLIEACDTWDIPDQPARAFRDDQGRVQIQFGANEPRRNIGSDLNAASSFGHHDCTVTSQDGRDPNPSHYDMYSWLAAPYTFDGHTVYSLVHEEFRGWEAAQPYSCQPPNNDTTKCWYNAITLKTSTNSGDRYAHTPAPSHLVASVPYTWVNQTGPYGVFSPSNIIRKQPDDGYLYVIVRAKEPGNADISCVMRTQATPQALGSPTSWLAWGDGPDPGSTDSYEVQFVNPYTYNFTNDPPANHMCKDIGGGIVTGVSESLTYNTYFGKYMLVGAYGNPVPGFFYSLSDDLINWSQNKLLIGLETQHSWQCGDPDPARDPSLLDPSSSSRNFETTGRQLYVYYKIFRLNLGCSLGPDRDLLRLPIGLQGGPANVPPTASLSASASTAQTNQAVGFDGSASTDPDGAITRITNYKWDLDGNGTFENDTGTTPTASRSYSAPGKVNVALRVSDIDGATSDTSRIVTVNGPGGSGPTTSPTGAPAAKVSCKTLKKKRAALTRRLRTARRKLSHSHSSAAKQRYRKQIKSLRKRIKRLRRTPCHR